MAGSGVRRARTKAFFIEEKQRELIKPNLFSAYLLAYAELDKTTIDARNWGYKNQILYPVIKDKMLHTNLFRLKNDLTFWNPNTRERVVHNPILTVEEAKAEAERLGLDKQPEVKLAKHAQIEFVFRNDNEMPINNVRINIDEVRDGKPVYSILRAQRPISEIPSKQRFPRVPVDVYLGLDDPFPSRTHYRITIDYDLMGKPQPSRQIMTHYEASSDRWVWEG